MAGATEWDLFQSLHAVLEAGSLSAAAKGRGLTQPTLGRHIETLADGRDVVVGHGEGAVGAADRAVMGAQPGEGLRRGHLVDQVQVDVEDRLAVRPILAFLGDDVGVPDLVVEGLAGHGPHVGPPTRARLGVPRGDGGKRGVSSSTSTG